MTEPRWRARTERLDGEVDLVAAAGARGTLWCRGRHGFAGRGEAMRISVPPGDPAAAAKAVHAELDRIEIDETADGPGQGPIAIGALPFDPDAPGELIVPEVIVGRAEDGRRWLTMVGPPDALDDHDRVDAAREVALASPEPAADREPGRITVSSPLAPATWCDRLVAAREELRAGAARKVVLARELVVEADRPFDQHAVLAQLRATYPSCMLFAVDQFIGASPELLVARSGDQVRSHPMAGTAPRSADPNSDAQLAANLLASAKDRAEHRYTIDMVHDALLPWCSYLDEEAEPQIVAMANVQHLATLVEGRLSAPAASVIELVRALHPTPAVNGAPHEAALALIARYEGIDRGRYAGAVGWVDARGDGAWTVGIRSAQLQGNQARLMAGVGVVADSDPAAELAETRAKFQALLGALIRP